MQHLFNPISGNYLRACASRLVELIEEHGLDCKQVYEGAGLGQYCDVFPNELVTWEHYSELLCYLDKPDLIPGVGLLVGSQTCLEDLGILGYASQFSRSIWEGKAGGIPFISLFGWQVYVEHKNIGSTWVEVCMKLDSNLQFERAIYEQWAMLSLVGIIRLMKSADEFDFKKMQFYFPYAEAPHISLYHKYFQGAELHFDAPACSWLYPHEWNKYTVHSGKHSALTYCSEKIALINKQVQIDGNIVDHVKAYIYTHFFDGFPSMVQAAENFNMSIATLRRRLNEHDANYASLVENIRKEMAAHLISNPDILAEDIAYNLGYKHPSNFYAVFKTWFGCSTKEYRQKLLDYK